MLSNVLIFSFLAGLSTLSGIFFVHYFKEWTGKNVIYLISFGIGVLLANAFFYLLPESISINAEWFYWALGTIVFLYIIEHFLIIHSCPEEKCEVHTVGTISLIGVGFHALVDGVIIGLSFGVGFALGLLVSLAVIFHKTAEGIITYTLLIHDKIFPKKAFWYSIGIALSTPLGAVMAFLFLQKISPEILGGLLAAAAGSFIYIGASDLVPETHKKYSFFNIFFVIAGILFVLIISRFLK